uniref:Carboxylic ester hydrolase n=1 Tax=Timema genevievae TaxID=629358 RepID=A0A7R9PNG1_TIMGE|nr:unnamed protein product [Timema genevievae]
MMFVCLSREEPVSGEEVIVETSQGELLGATSTTADGTHYFTFRGVPYAKPPVGPLRFKSPQEAEPWKGQRDARQFATRCLQEDGGSEDCLYLNIFTPQLGPNSNLPVMVWFHWGAFAFGSADLDPGHLMDLGVMVAEENSSDLVTVVNKVCINEFAAPSTRILEGFLSLEGTDVPGNAGLKDQVAALRWINKNINQFGGDADRVTLFGCSAGGSSVHFHILSPLSTGLFHRGISQSGTATDPWAYIEQSQSYAFRLGRNLGLQTEDPQELLDLLRNVPADELEAAVVKLLKPDEKTRYYIFPFLPSLEYSSRTEEPFLAQHPDYIEHHGNFNKVPYITGVNKMEGKFSIVSDPTNNDVSQLSYWETINSDLERVVPVDLGLEKGSPESLQVANKVKEFYFGDREISLETKEQWIELQSDILFNVKTQFTVRQFANRSNSTYNYHFTYNNSAHTQEMDYLFYQDKVVGESSRDANIANYIGTLWANFAKTGVPLFQGGVKWEPVSKSRLYYLKIDDKLSLEEELEKERIDFWLDIYNSYQKSGLTFSPVTGRLDGEL